MASRILPEEAARRLDQELRGRPWYLTTGVGESDDGHVLFVYVKRISKRDSEALEQGWLGYPVIVEAMGGIRAIAS